MLSSVVLLKLILSTLCIAAAGYLINDYYDVKIDYINKPDRVVIGRELGRRQVILTHTILSSIGILLGFSISWVAGLSCIITAFLLWLYSNNLKRMPLVGNLVVAALVWFSLYYITFPFSVNNKLIIAFAGFAGLTTLIREIIKDMEDIKGDEAFGCKTLPIVLGIAYTKLVLLPLNILLLLVLFFMSQEVPAKGLQSVFYCLILLVLVGAWQAFRADTQKHFSWLSAFWKVIMAVGILSMILF